MSTTSGRRDGAGALASSESSSREEPTKEKAKRPKPITEESFPVKLVFRGNDCTYIDGIVDPQRKERAGPKEYPPSAMFAALLLMYLKRLERPGLDTVPEL